MIEMQFYSESSYKGMGASLQGTIIDVKSSKWFNNIVELLSLLRSVTLCKECIKEKCIVKFTPAIFHRFKNIIPYIQQSKHNCCYALHCFKK
jgi:hypothetical protein